MNPVKVLSDHSCFIALHVPDKVPGQIVSGGPVDFLQALLNEILAEITLPRGGSRQNLIQGL